MTAFPALSPRRSRLFAVGALLSIIAAVAVASPPAEAAKPRVKVMTRNLYLGADLIPVLTAPNAGALAVAATGAYNQVVDTNFRARAKRIAQEIADKKPHLIGLQEVARWRRDMNGAPDGPATPATEEIYNFLPMLMQEIRRLGLPYRRAGVQRELDAELPLSLGWDARLTMRDAVLVKKGAVKVTKRFGDNYTTKLPAPTALGVIPVDRGFVGVDAKVNGRKVRFVNTHLEAYDDTIRLAQAAELAGATGPLNKSGQVILVGDLNSDPAAGDASSDAYNAIAAAGFKDRGVTNNTSGHDADLLNADLSGFDSRIDHVMTNPGMKKLSARRVGIHQEDRTPYGLWPSDHAGVFAKLR